ncbi:MAG: GNAT family N-acetyltransferase [Oscillospiraceae bacterium]|nr:GNAT family N-acetyltransferase [Oscillospiraceae bacterium]
MNLDHPSYAHIPQLRQLWKEAFGDTDQFLDHFYGKAFSPDRCLCAFLGNEVVAMAYWFDCEEYAYIYAVATAKAHRGKGISHTLMARIHEILTQRGYCGCLLVPGEESLRHFYRDMGYENCGGVEELDVAATDPVTLRKLTQQEYGDLRSAYLPQGGVIQRGVNLDFLACWAQFYEGEDALLAAVWEDGKLLVLELLGNQAAAPGIVAALGADSGWFRAPGETPFAMHRPLNGNLPPKYFGFCF